MKVNQTLSICPRLRPVQLPGVGKCLSINSATRICRRNARMTGTSSVRSWVMVICSLIPRAYLHSHFLAKIRANCESEVRSNCKTRNQLHERLPPSRWESSGVSHRPGAPVQLDPLSAPGPERGQVWGGSGGRSRPDSGLDAQPANPHVGRLSMCACTSPPLNSVECETINPATSRRND